MAAAALLGLLAGCGTETAPTAHDLPPKDERVPITQRAIAAIALAHLPDDTTMRVAMHDDGAPAGLVGADLRYAGDGEYDGDLVEIAIHPDDGGPACGRDLECAELDTDVEGARAWLTWEEEVPEEDPGIVSVAFRHDGELSYVLQSGAVITGDPRELDLHITVGDMLRVLEDPWLRLRTSPEAVEAGGHLDDWAGEP